MLERWTSVALATMLAFAIGACASTETAGPGSEPDRVETDEPDMPADPAPPPWRQFTLGADDVPPEYLEAWQEAENRTSCALIAPDSLGRGEGATPRRAQFGGGWGVAYDLPETRSAFGVAGTGVSDTSSTYDEWPYHRRWADGSTAGYGPEGGSGPNQLAYLRIAGQECLYNVWSRLGVEHLEYLLEHLRHVATD